MLGVGGGGGGGEKVIPTAVLAYYQRVYLCSAYIPMAMLVVVVT